MYVAREYGENDIMGPAPVAIEDRELLHLPDLANLPFDALRRIAELKAQVEADKARAAERKRVELIIKSIHNIESVPLRMQDKPSADIREMVTRFEDGEIDFEALGEYSAKAKFAQQEALAALRALLSETESREAQEAEAARIKVEQEALEAQRRAEEHAEIARQRAELERQHRANAERLQAERAEADLIRWAEEAKLEEERRKIAEERAAEEAKQRVEREAQEAENLRLAAEREALARQQAEVEAQQREVARKQHERDTLESCESIEAIKASVAAGKVSVDGAIDRAYEIGWASCKRSCGR